MEASGVPKRCTQILGTVTKQYVVLIVAHLY